MKVWIDPPSGWTYGFPKIYDAEVDGDIQEWMLRNGCPFDIVELFHYRAWPVHEDEFTESA